MEASLSLFLVLLAVIYLLFPFDLIRDFIPFIGYLDDILLIVWIIYLINKRKHFYFRQQNKYEQGNSYNNCSGGFEEKIKDPYEILGVSKNCVKSEVKKAYRDLASKYHPDKVAHLGDDFKEYANQKFIEINNAYEKIFSEKGW